MNDRGLRLGLLALGGSLASAVLACSAPAGSDDAESQEQAAVSDIAGMTARGDGTFDVTCRSGRTEVVSAADVEQGRVCKPAALPSSPFQSGACTGTPMTEAGARARLAAAGESPVVIGKYVLGLRRRDARYTWNGRGYDTTYRWVDAPNDALVAWRETESSRTEEARFSGRGSVELAAEAGGAPYLRLVGEASNQVGPDTTGFLRLVSRPLRPWSTPGHAVGPKLEIEARRGEAPWARLTEYGWSVQTSEQANGGKHRSWWFQGNDVTAIVTESCGQFVSAQSLSALSPVQAAIGIAIVLD